MAIRSSDLRPLINISGCGCLIFFRISMKNGLAEANTTLCASICCPSSQARVTSVNSLSSLSSLNEEVIFSLKSFHWRHSFSTPVIVEVDVLTYVKTRKDANSVQNFIITHRVDCLRIWGQITNQAIIIFTTFSAKASKRLYFTLFQIFCTVSLWPKLS